ncbi:MAG: AI-2E family transporter [Bacteroidota bacterium]
MGFFNILFPKKITGKDEPADSEGVKVQVSHPFYIKAPAVLLGLCLFVYILILLQDILVPVCFATLIAILLNPIVNRLMKWRIPKPVSIGIAVLLAAIVFAGLIIFLSSQVSNFTEMAPQLKQRGSQIISEAQGWVESTFNFSKAKQNAALQNTQKNMQPFLTGMLGSLMGVISVFVLLPIYIFLILYYKPLFLNFFYEVFEDRYENKVAEILSETKNAIQKYISGLLIEMVIVATLNSTALLILGVKYAVLIGVIGAILNLVPYIGGLIAIALPVILSIVAGDGGLTTPLLVIGSYLLIQFIDNNFLVPKIVASKVDVNAFVSIIIVLMGGAMWGVSGMFLSIPFIAICKIIFDRIGPLKPWGKLLGVKMGEDPPKKVVNEIDADKIN